MMERVATLIQEVSASTLERRFQLSPTQDVEEKSPGEVVTAADREAETRLAAGLGAITAGIPVVGEQGCAADPSLLGLLNDERVWLVDPLDGTANYMAGSPDWAVMVALVARGLAVASWIWQPVARRMYLAEQGAGAFADGARLYLQPRPTEARLLRGAALTRFMDPAISATVARNRDRFREIRPGRRCSGVEYPSLLDGTLDFALFWRTLPWDHAPGALLIEEAGGKVGRPDGSMYRPAAAGVGLLVAAGTPFHHLGPRSPATPVTSSRR